MTEIRLETVWAEGDKEEECRQRGENRDTTGNKDSSSTQTLTVSGLYYYVLINLTFNFYQFLIPRSRRNPF